MNLEFRNMEKTAELQLRPTEKFFYLFVAVRLNRWTVRLQTRASQCKFLPFDERSHDDCL